MTSPGPTPPATDGRFRLPGSAAWVVAYLAVVAAPLVVIELGSVPRRGFWIEFAVGLGFVGLAMMALQTVLTARVPRISLAVGQDRILQFHRQAGLVAFAIVLAHPALLVIAEPEYRSFLDPRENLPRAVALTLVLVALPVLIVSSLWRERLRLPYQWWRLLHASLAALVLLVGLAHISQVRHYLANAWKQGLWITIATASAAGVIYARVVQPYRLRRHPYRVTAVESVAHRIWAIKLAPLRGRALRFRPGQFAFVTFADSPFALEQHPFSLASSSHDPETIEFAIRELGDFTSTIGTLEVDQPAFVHGPFGSLVIADDDPADLVLLAGGIGLTPLLSIVRSRRDAGDQRQILLIHAVNTVDDLAYRQELTDHSADETMQFTYVPVVADPPPEWTGDVGYITSELIAHHLGGHDLTTPRYLLCGPPPMMEALEKALRSVGVPLDRIDSERFDLGAANAVGERHQRIRRAVLLLGAVLVAITALVAL